LLEILGTHYAYFCKKRQLNCELRDRCHSITLVAKNPQLSQHDFIIIGRSSNCCVD